MIERYRGDLKKAGIDSVILAEIQAEGLFDQDAKTRLEYLKETKKDFGLNQPDQIQQTNIQVVLSRGEDDES